MAIEATIFEIAAVRLAAIAAELLLLLLMIACGPFSEDDVDVVVTCVGDDDDEADDEGGDDGETQFDTREIVGDRLLVDNDDGNINVNSLPDAA